MSEDIAVSIEPLVTVKQLNGTLFSQSRRDIRQETLRGVVDYLNSRNVMYTDGPNGTLSALVSSAELDAL
ncbi:hypothetical protein J4457_03730 [Candidatus Woesearchaeota archaeon]|nr:hypothetical protein [Candidatus Woesearchaeota archaeon]